MPTAAEKVFLDTAPFIYWLESHPIYYPKIEQYITQLRTDNVQLITSVLTYFEYCVKLEELGRWDLIDDFLALTTDLHCPLIPITVDITTKAYHLRAAHKSLKAMDALQLATAVINNCQIFVTNDKRLRGVTGVDVMILDDIQL